MSRFILNPRNLRRLPITVQEFVNALDETQLSHLQAAFSNQAFFDLLGLPQELRLLVYKYALADGPARLRKGTFNPLPAVGLFTTNKRISDEALMVFKESKQCVINFGDTHRMLPNSKVCLRYFRHFMLQIPVNQTQFLWLRNYNGLCKFLLKIHQHLIEDRMADECKSRITLHIKFTHVGGLDKHLGKGDLDTFHHKQSFHAFTLTQRLSSTQRKCIALYYMAQLQNFLSIMRNQLKEQLPDSIITSNVDGEWPNTKVSEVGPSVVKFFDEKRQKAGSVEREAEGWKVVF